MSIGRSYVNAYSAADRICLFNTIFFYGWVFGHGGCHSCHHQIPILFFMLCELQGDLIIHMYGVVLDRVVVLYERDDTRDACCLLHLGHAWPFVVHDSISLPRIMFKNLACSWLIYVCLVSMSIWINGFSHAYFYVWIRWHAAMGMMFRSGCTPQWWDIWYCSLYLFCVLWFSFVGYIHSILFGRYICYVCRLVLVLVVPFLIGHIRVMACLAHRSRSIRF